MVRLARVALDPPEVRVPVKLDPAVGLRRLLLEPEPDLAIAKQARRECHDQLRTVPCMRVFKKES